MKKAILFAAFASLSLTGVARAEGTSREATEARLRHAGEVLHEVMGAPDKGIPEEVLQHAKCIAVVPHLVKGGFVFGAEGGRGVATCRTANGWSAPAFFSITGGNWGLQIGVEGIDLVMIFQGDHGMDRRRCFSGRGAGWASCLCRYRLEDECGDSDLLARQGNLCRHHAERRGGPSRRRLHQGFLWA